MMNILGEKFEALMNPIMERTKSIDRRRDSEKKITFMFLTSKTFLSIPIVGDGDGIRSFG